jgi:glycosyltransferase involved in cell wall biosynthesis
MSFDTNSQHVESDSTLDGALRLALVLWKGDVGGAEVLTATLAERMPEMGARVTIVFVGHSRPLSERLIRADIPYSSLELNRGRDLLRHPRLYADEIARCGPDGALVVERGFMGAALRAGGYRSPIVAVEHGDLLGHLRRSRGPARRVSRAAGAWAVDAEVAVSDFMLDRMLGYAHAGRALRIYNGVDPDTYSASDHISVASDALVVGFAGRLIPGKGTDHLICACIQLSEHQPVKLLIAGDGPERLRLSSLAQMRGPGAAIEFLGVVHDIPTLWQQCDVVVVPSDTFEESFSMVTLEAMTCGKAIVATRNGAIPELVLDGVTGTLVAPGKVDELANALLQYAKRPELRRQHGSAARERAVARFHINFCAQAYVDLFVELAQTYAAEAA